MEAAVTAVPPAPDWQRVLRAYEYDLERRRETVFLARSRGVPVAVVHPKGYPRDFGRLDAEGRPPEGLLINDATACGVPYALLVSGSRLRLFDAAPVHGAATGRYLELDAAVLAPEDRPFLGLLGPAYLEEGGFRRLQDEARACGAALWRRLDDRVRHTVLPTLGTALGRWAVGQGYDLGDDAVREELREGTLVLVSRALSILHAESAWHPTLDHEPFPLGSLSTLARAATDIATAPDPTSTRLWGGFSRRVNAMRTGKSMLLSRDSFDGATIVERAELTDSDFGAALVGLGYGIDYSTLETGQLGHLYEGLLSLQLSVGKNGAGDLVWRAYQGGRKSAGAYYTRAELARHLVRTTVVPAFARHLQEVRAIAARDPRAAAERLFEFAVLDPACGGAHFLVHVVDELADLVVSFLAETPLPRLSDELGGGDAALLRRLVLERCVYGVDLSPTAVEIAKLSLWHATRVPGLPPARLDRTIQVGDALVGLDWPSAFPRAFDRPNPGFDAVVGNPPWEEVTVEAQSFYALYRPGLRRGLSEAERDAAVARLVAERPDLPGKLAAQKDGAARQRASLAAAFPAMSGDPDLAKYFCQRYRTLLRDGGVLGVVLPRTTFVNQGSRDFRCWLFEQATCERIDFLTNRGRWAFDTHPQYTVALVAARKEIPAPDHRVRLAGTATSLASWQEQARSPGLVLARRTFGPDWRPPLLRSRAEADVLEKVRRGLPLPRGPGWRCFPVRELDETSDRALWRDAQEGWPLWKGQSFGQYDPHGAGARVCPDSDAVRRKAEKPRPGARSLTASELSVAARRAAVRAEIGRARVAFTDVTQKDNARTVIACLVPPRTFLTNKAPYLAFAAGDERARAACLGVMNSLPFDWQARRFVEITLNFFILEGLVVPDLAGADHAAIAGAASRLSCVDERFAEFAASVGVVCGPLDRDERERLRAEIDARVARAWGLTPDDLAVVYQDFTPRALPATYRERLTRRLAELS